MTSGVIRISETMSKFPSAIERILRRSPEEGFFGGKPWILSPEPFPLSRSQITELEDLGELLNRFIKACDEAYRRSKAGSLPGWIGKYLDKGKPDFLLRMGQSPALSPSLPQVIRPDVLLTTGGFVLSELDSVPGGIGFTDFLHDCYKEMGWDLVGGDSGMRDGFAGLFPAGADIALSNEAADYRQEMKWLASSIGGERFRVRAAETYQPEKDIPIYRFFELFDHANVPFLRASEQALMTGEMRMVSPPKAFHEEKLWFALFHRPQLRDYWRRALRDSGFRKLQDYLPYSWVMDPTPIPHHAAIPRLDLSSWEEVGQLGRQERQLVLKVSGFSEEAWGSRGVRVGHDMSQEAWASAIAASQERFERSPSILQEFHGPRRVSHPIWNKKTARVEEMEGRVRLCPYYFLGTGKVKLAGVLATIAPMDKKVVHGMEEATMVPCCVVD